MSSRAPRLVVDARMVRDGGIGTYIQALLPRIAGRRPDWRFSVLGRTADMRALGWGELRNLRLQECTAKIFGIREQFEVPLRADSDAQLFWAPHYNVPAALRLPLAVTIHDLNHLALPELMGSALRRRYARRLLAATMARARQVLFVSDFTRSEAVRLLGPAAGTGVVIHSAAGEEWSRVAVDTPIRPLDEPYFLYVGNIKRHKNVPFLLRAFRRVRHEIPHLLVLIGRTEGLRADPGVARELAQCDGRVRMLGETDKDTVRRYVAHAEALVTASLYEGFGLPPLEAMAAGCPCVVSSAGSLPEVCGDAVLYADPRSEESFARRLLEVARDPVQRARLVERGRARAAQFNWDLSAERTAKALETALTTA